jgi:predicted secreted protein
MAKKTIKRKVFKRPNPKKRPQSRPVPQQQQAPQQGQPQVAPPAPSPAPTLPWGERVQSLSKSLGQNSGGIGKGLAQLSYKGPLGFAEGLGQGIGGPIGGKIAKYGTLGYVMGKVVPWALEKAGRTFESDEKKETRVKTENQTKYEDKVTTAIMGGRTNGFSLDDLDAADKNQDAGWRESIEGMDDKEFSTLAAESIKADDANKIWNAVITKAQRDGKKVNASKPLFLPNTFTKEGKNYSYAIHYDKEARQAKFVPIEIGGQPFGREVKE